MATAASKALSLLNSRKELLESLGNHLELRKTSWLSVQAFVPEFAPMRRKQNLLD